MGYVCRNRGPRDYGLTFGFFLKAQKGMASHKNKYERRAKTHGTPAMKTANGFKETLLQSTLQIVHGTSPKKGPGPPKGDSSNELMVGFHVNKNSMYGVMFVGQNPMSWHVSWVQGAPEVHNLRLPVVGFDEWFGELNEPLLLVTRDTDGTPMLDLQTPNHQLISVGVKKPF